MADLRDALMEALRGVEEAGLNLNVVQAGLVRQLDVSDDKIRCDLTLITPASPYQDSLRQDAERALAPLAGERSVSVQLVPEVPSDGRNRGLARAPIKNAIAVASGKGGVGKSTVAVNLAAALAHAGASVGLLDADVYGPNVPTMMGVDRLPPAFEGGMTPAEAFGVRLISIAFLVKPGQPLIWRGPMLHSAIRQFVSDVAWGPLDYLVVDLPPGTGDAPLSLSQSMPLSGAVIVTLPQKVSLEDASRSLEMFRTMEVPVFGVIENMSFLELPDGTRVDVFGEGGGRAMAEQYDTPFLGALPMDPSVRQAGDAGVPFVISHPDSAAARSMLAITQDLAVRVSVAALKHGQPIPIQILD